LPRLCCRALSNSDLRPGTSWSSRLARKAGISARRLCRPAPVRTTRDWLANGCLSLLKYPGRGHYSMQPIVPQPCHNNFELALDWEKKVVFPIPVLSEGVDHCHSETWISGAMAGIPHSQGPPGRCGWPSRGNTTTTKGCGEGNGYYLNAMERIPQLHRRMVRSTRRYRGGQDSAPTKPGLST
jgi:hypothetical protein